MFEDLVEIKNKLRSKSRKKRADLTQEYRRDASRCICDHILSWDIFHESQVIFTYMPMNGEVDLLPLIHGKPDKQWLIPRIQPGSQMILHPYHADKLILHKFGMLEPNPELPQISPHLVDLVLVPGLVFDRQGWRLGYGGGFYDTFLSNFPDVHTLGITYRAFLLPNVPHMAHDIPVKMLVTEEGILKINSRLDE